MSSLYLQFDDAGGNSGHPVSDDGMSEWRTGKRAEGAKLWSYRSISMVGLKISLAKSQSG